MGFLIYFIGCAIATLIITFILDDDWRTEGLSLGDLLINSIYGLLSWFFVLGFAIVCFIGLIISFISGFNFDLQKIYLIKPKK